MNLLYFIRLLLKHIALLIIMPIVFVAIVFYLTRDEPKSYRTNASVYTGIATGSSIVSLEESRMDYFGTRTAFDNLINLITARSTIEEVGVRLLASHLLLDEPTPEFIERQHYIDLMRIVPDDVKALVVKGNFDRTLRNLKAYRDKDHSNFIYELINYEHRHYSSKRIRSNTRVNRIQTSDMIDVLYTADDPGICKQTLDILIDVFISEYSLLKVNQSDAVVRYFQGQLDISNEGLNQAENELLQFNRDNNIINYHEQTKHVASEREHVNLVYMDIQMSHAASESVMKALESRMSARERTRVNSAEIKNLRNQLAKVNLEIALKTNLEKGDEQNEAILIQEISDLREQSIQLQQLLDEVVSNKFNLENTTEGVQSETILRDWLTSMIEYETSKAKLMIGRQKQGEFRQLFENYAPLGATMKRLERKIDVAEREYLSLLHSLNLAKLKQQNIELNSNLSIVAPPFYPIVSEPSKRKFMLAIAFLIGFILPAFTIIILEFLDQNIRNTYRAESFTGLNVAAIFPVLGLNKNIDIEFVKNRGLDIVSRRLILNTEAANEKTKPDINLVFSVLEGEGKTLLIESLLDRLSQYGYRVLLLKPQSVNKNNEVVEHVLYYQINNSFHRVNSISDLDADWTDTNIADYDYIFVEIPGVLNNTYPIKLFKSAHHSFLVTRANRPWSKADKHAVKDIIEFTKSNSPQILLNGVAIEEMETVLGDLPKHRTFIRRLVKNVLRLQFFSKKSMGAQYNIHHDEESSRNRAFPIRWLLLALLFVIVASVGYFVVYPKYKAQKTQNIKMENFPVVIDIEEETTGYPIIEETSNDEALKAPVKAPQVIVKHQVVVGVFRSNDNARQSYNLYKQFGFEPAIVEIPGDLFRVIVGSYNTRDEAEKIRKEVNDFVPHADANIVLATEMAE